MVKMVVCIVKMVVCTVKLVVCTVKSLVWWFVWPNQLFVDSYSGLYGQIGGL